MARELIYPPEYTAGFTISNEQAIAKFANYLTAFGVTTGVYTETNDSGTIDYIGRGDFLTQINWAEPEKTPADYPQYASTFWRFYGPNEIQQTRAKLLATQLSVNLDVKPNHVLLYYPSLGLELVRFTSTLSK